MSVHLAVLARANLVTFRRDGRSIIYRANLDTLRDLTVHLLRDCCGGKPEICAPVIDMLQPCCPPKETTDVTAV
jgi:DNA-binding transcriptional ArsR family regulator